MKRARLFYTLLAAYLFLLAGSHLARRARDQPTPAEGLAFVELPQSAPGDCAASGRLAWRRWLGRPLAADRPAVLLLHGSPGSSRDFAALGPRLGRDRPAIAPDLPGFGQSSARQCDYSISTHAGAAAALIDRLELESVHVVGFSMGGGVALELAELRPDAVRSLTLLSSIGLQEYELLGNHSLNHAVHGLQLAALWVLHEATPHFGWLDDALLDVAYARNFFDTDQRPLRGIFERLAMPVLIVHGRHDVLVPAAAAREHHRIVPQSELVMLDANHFITFRAEDRLVDPIRAFLERVDAGAALDRSRADAGRLAAARAPLDPSPMPAASGLALLVLLVLIAAATFVSEDATCIATGLLVAQGRLGILAGSAACAVGILLGDLAIYAAGRYLGRPWLGRRPLSWVVSPRALARGSAWFARRGPIVIVASRFLPGTRVATYFSAGLFKTSFWKFLGYFLIAVVLWTPALVGLSAWLGSRLTEAFGAFERWALPGVLGAALGVTLAVKLARRLASWRGRRLLLGSLRRKLEWEFWPWWVIYLPLFPWILWQGLRHRGWTVFTAANPGIEAGGFAGESKAAILEALDPRSIARFVRIPRGRPEEERWATARAFLEREQLAFPVVLKPDVGERGAGFRIARTERELERGLGEASADLLVQEYVGGVELGVFYVRRPSEERGRIFSITEKRLLELSGDGVSSVETLILADERAMRMAPIHLDKLAGQLERVPAAGERVPLVELGVHSRGSLFLDGSHLATPELERAIEAIARSFEGFYFGRFDLRAPSFEDFRQGRRIKVLELNGVTSEATHIYDPENSYADALRVLARQWRLAFEIGSENRRRGVRPTGVLALSGLTWRHLTGG